MRTVLSLALSLSLVGCGAAPTEPKPPAPPPVHAPEPAEVPETAHLSVLSKAPADIELDGKKIGQTPIRNFEATPGKHDVRFVFGPGDSQTLTVTVVAGREATVQLDYVPPAK